MARRKGANSLQQLLTREVLLNMAGDRYFARGENYFQRGYVHDLVADEDGLTAEVSGTEEYYVELWADEGELRASCTCPLGVDDIFCKHCVAVGLTWLANPTVTRRTRKESSPASKPVTMQEVQTFLEQQDKSTLIQWILHRIQQDNDWRQQLFLKAASHRSQGLDITTFRRALRDAIAIRGYIEWNEVSDYVSGIGSVLESIQDLLDDHPQAVLELCAYAIPLIEQAMNSVDDSDGELGSVLEEFQDLHYQSCELASPNPLELAEYLFQTEMESGFGSFSNAVETYADILGDEGITHYRELAEAMWEEFPGSPSQKNWESSYKRGKLQRILETLAKASGDIEDVIAIKRQDLSRPHTYMEIAQLYLQDGQGDRALEWAEAGLQAFEQPNFQLREFVIEEYHRRGRDDEAMELVWQIFTSSITLRSYQTLKTHADRVNQWDMWRDRALAHIREQLNPPPPPKPAPTGQNKRSRRTPAVRAVATSPAWNPLGYGTRDRSILVEIFLWEGNDDLAWQEAQAGGCFKALWLQLAERRQQEHPEDALPIYQKEIEPLIQQTANSAYASAIGFLQKVHDLMIRLNRETEFAAFVDYLHRTYKAKRNFIGLLNRQSW